MKSSILLSLIYGTCGWCTSACKPRYEMAFLTRYSSLITTSWLRPLRLFRLQFCVSLIGPSILWLHVSEFFLWGNTASSFDISRLSIIISLLLLLSVFCTQLSISLRNLISADSILVIPFSIRDQHCDPYRSIDTAKSLCEIQKCFFS